LFADGTATINQLKTTITELENNEIKKNQNTIEEKKRLESEILALRTNQNNFEYHNVILFEIFNIKLYSS
jgi:peptidoglycan hydrolase CwlO-like protein